MKKNSNIIAGGRHDKDMVMSVFESFAKWQSVKEYYKIENGDYFSVGVLHYQQKRKRNIGNGHLFVQGYARGSSVQETILARRFGRILVNTIPEAECEGDMHLVYGNVYKAVNDNEIELVFKNGEWLEFCNVQKLFERICVEEKLVAEGEILRYKFECKKSSRYFLEGRTYHVWGVRIDYSNGFAVDKVLFCDLASGVPSLIDIGDGRIS